MKPKSLAIALLAAALAAPCFAGGIHVTADLSADFGADATAQAVISTFSLGSQPLLWGCGWEIIPDRVGFGGSYDVSFFQEEGSGWWLDWECPAVFMSYHPLGANRLLDPFLQVGAGCAGRVNLGMGAGGVYDNLFLSLYPFAAGGLALNLDGLLLQVKGSYTPYNGAIPVTDFSTYPLGKFQVTLSGGLALTW
jgi:hypothetical protein